MHILPPRRFFTSFAKYAFLIVLGLFFLFPLFAMLSRSLMTDQETSVYPALVEISFF